MDQMTLQKYGCKLVGMVPCSDSFGVDLIIEKIVASAKPAPASDSLEDKFAAQLQENTKAREDFLKLDEG